MENRWYAFFYRVLPLSITANRMNWNLLPDIIFVLLISAMSFGIAIFGWCRSSSNRVASCFAILVVGIGIYCFSYALEISSVTLSSSLFWFNLRFLGIGLISPGLMTFTILYTHREKWMNVRVSLLLGIESLLMLVLAYTNDFHHLVYTDPQMILNNQVKFLSLDFGIVIWINTIYNLLISMICVIMIILHVNRAPGIFRWQSLMLILGILFPWIVSFFSIFNTTSIPPYKWIHYSLLISNICYALAIYRFGFLKITPVARDVLVEKIPDCVLVLDQNDHVIDINPSAQKTLGINSYQAVGLPVSQLMEKLNISVLQQKQKYIISLENVSGKHKFELRISPLKDWHNSNSGKLYILHDITENTDDDKALQESEAFHRSLIELAYDGISVVDEKNILYANQRMCHILGRDESDILGKPFTDFIPIKILPKISATIQNQIKGNVPRKIYESSLIHSSGKEIPVEMITNVIHETEHDKLLIIVRDITERKRSEARLKQLATTDDLTGCFNRRHFFSLAKKEFERTRRYHLELSIILLDIDHFKNINDSYGHIMGDRVLQNIAHQCHHNLREWDILARYGGEEFIILLPDTPIQNARQTAERLRAVVEKTTLRSATKPIRATISLGVAGFTHEENLSLETLLERSDRALYNAKEKGRNRVQVWSPTCTINV